MSLLLYVHVAATCFRTNSWLLPGLFADHDLTRGSGQEVFKISRAGSDRVKKLSILADGVRSGQEFSNLTGWVGLGQEYFKSYGLGRVGSRGDENLMGRVKS